MYMITIDNADKDELEFPKFYWKILLRNHILTLSSHFSSYLQQYEIAVPQTKQ